MSRSARRAGSGATRVDVSFVTSGHDVADARLHRLVDACVRRGLSVEVRGLGRDTDAPVGALVHTVPRPGVLARGPLAFRLVAGARGRVIVALDPDTVVAAGIVGRLRRRRVVADVHEDYARLLRDRPWARGWRGPAARMLVRVATEAAARSDLTVVADAHVPPMVAARRMVARNEADLSHIGQPVEHDPQPRAVYIGDVRRSRGVLEMLETLAASPSWSLDIIGPVAVGDQPLVDQWLAESPARDRVTFHGRLTPRAAWDVARGAWVGMALLHDTPAFRDALPSKIGEYLAAGVLPLVTDLPRQRLLIEEAGCGHVVSTSHQAASYLRSLQADPGERMAQRERGLRWAHESRRAATSYDEVAAALQRLAADHAVETRTGDSL